MSAPPILPGKIVSDSRAANQWFKWGRRFVLFSTLALLALGSAAAQARVIYVNGRLPANPIPDGSTWATAWGTIGAALQEAGDGDEVWVAQGTYKEFVTLTNGVALYGGFAGTETDRDQRNFTWNITTIYGDGGGISLTNDVVSVLEVTNTLARLDGFTVDKNLMVVGGAISTTNSSPVIANNRICGLTNFVYGVITCSGGAPLITNNYIANNGKECVPERADWGNMAGGIYCSECNAHIIRNQFIGNKAVTGGGISIYCGSPLVEFNDVVGNSAAAFSGGVDCFLTSAKILNNRILKNQVVSDAWGESSAGITVSFCTEILIANNLVISNIKHTESSSSSISKAAGIYCRTNVSGEIINNTILYNQGGAAGGVFCSSPEVLIANNIIAFNSSGMEGATNIQFVNNCVFGNGTNDFIGMTNPTGTNGNISRDPMLDGDSQHAGWYLTPESPCIGAGDASLVSPDWLDIDGEPRMQNSHVDIGADEFHDGGVTPLPIICHVSPAGDDRNDGLSWATAGRTVQAGVNKAVLTGGEVWVAGGFYPERITMHPSVDLYGGFAGVETSRDQRDWKKNETILDGQGSERVVLILNLPTTTHLDGFTIQNGRSINGGGILASNSSIIIANNIIQNNIATNSDYMALGGGVCASSCSMVLSNNLIQDNISNCGGGAALNTDTTNLVVRNMFKSNTAAYGSSAWSRGGGGLFAAGSKSGKYLNNVFMALQESSGDFSLAWNGFVLDARAA